MRQKIVWFVLGVLIGSLFLVAAYPQGSSPKNNIPPFQKIDNSIPVYYIGNETPKYFLRTAKVTGFRKIKSPHILIVEGSHVENISQLKHFIKEEVLSGIPVIVKDNPELLRGIFKGQFYPRIAGGRNPDGTTPKERVYGYVTYPLPDGRLASKVFISIDPSPESIKDAYHWAVENLQPHAGSLEIEPLSSGAYWEYLDQLNLTTGDDWKPYGRLNIKTIYYWLVNDNSASYDWFDIHVRQQSVPGKELGWSDWRTSDMYTRIDADYYNPNGFLSDYSPTTTCGSDTVTVSIGVSAGNKEEAQVSASQSWSYIIPDVMVHDQSDFSQELAKWWHDVAEDKAVGEDTYMIEPGATLRFPESGSKEWQEHYGIIYAKPPRWWEPGWYWDYTSEYWIEVHITMG